MPPREAPPDRRARGSAAPGLRPSGPRSPAGPAVSATHPVKEGSRTWPNGCSNARAACRACHRIPGLPERFRTLCCAVVSGAARTIPCLRTRGASALGNPTIHSAAAGGIIGGVPEAACESREQRGRGAPPLSGFPSLTRAAGRSRTDAFSTAAFPAFSSVFPGRGTWRSGRRPSCSPISSCTRSWSCHGWRDAAWSGP